MYDVNNQLVNMNQDSTVNSSPIELAIPTDDIFQQSPLSVRNIEEIKTDENYGSMP
jgi:hypothetical protein